MFFCSLWFVCRAYFFFIEIDSSRSFLFCVVSIFYWCVFIWLKMFCSQLQMSWYVYGLLLYSQFHYYVPHTHRHQHTYVVDVLSDDILISTVQYVFKVCVRVCFGWVGGVDVKVIREISHLLICPTCFNWCSSVLHVCNHIHQFRVLMCSLRVCYDYVLLTKTR